MRQRRGGCTALTSFLFVIALIVLVYNWPNYVDRTGIQTTGILKQKLESVSVSYGDWFRRFQIIIAFTVPGEAMEHHASCDVDEITYDSLHLNDTVTLHYLPTLLRQPFLPAAHLSPCTPWAAINRNPGIMRGLIWAAGSCLIILFLWKVLRIKLAAWLLIPWAAVFFVYAAMPSTEPKPVHPKAAQATIESVDTVTTLLETDESAGIDLDHPYQIVRLKYLPSGMDTPVVAIDKVDLGSVPNLQKGQTIAIEYDSEHPRMARINGGSREFPSLARRTLLWTSAAFVAFLLVVAVLDGCFG